MTTLQQIQFAAQVQIGNEIKGYGNFSMIVTAVTKHGFKGYSKYLFEKYGKKEETVYLSFETIANPHYNKNLQII